MSITVTWDNPERTVVRWDFDGCWDWDEYWAAQAQSNILIGSVDWFVYIIGDVTRSPTLPHNALGGYRSCLQNALPNMGLIVLVGAHVFVRTMVETFQRIYPEFGGNFTFAKNIDDARSLLAAHLNNMGKTVL